MQGISEGFMFGKESPYSRSSDRVVMHLWPNSDNEFAIKNDLKIFKELSKAKFCTQRYVFDVVVVLNHRVQYSSKHIKNQLGPPWDTKSARVSQK